MSFLRNSLELFPNYEAAGIKYSYARNGDATRNLISPQREVPATPEHMKRFRYSSKHADGVTITHYGKINDSLPPKSFTYGIKAPESHHVKDVLKDEALDTLAGVIRDMKEEKYFRNKNEPLGKTVERGYDLPAIISQKHFQFGSPTKMSEPVKEVLYSHSPQEEEERIKQLYIKSHLQYDPGQQRKRDYQWPFDPKGHSFGKTGPFFSNEAKLCISPEASPDNFPKTKIIDKHVEDFKDYQQLPIGYPKNHGHTNARFGPKHAYGYVPKNRENWTVEKCIKGEEIVANLFESPDLGKATKFGFRNVPHIGDESRIFGVPTIRNDLKRTLQKSVADMNNYGDEPEAVALLFPERFHSIGVSKKEFDIPRQKEEIKRLFANIGHNYKPGKFEGIFMRSQELSGYQGEETSVNGFIAAIKEMAHLD